MRLKSYPDCIMYLNNEGTCLAQIEFPEVEKGRVVDINRTYVDDSLRGKGVAGILMEACVETLECEGLLARTSCSYAQHWFEKHPEKAHLLDK